VADLSRTAGRAVLLDRDGVINRRRPGHVRSWAEFEFLPGALEALRRLRVAGERVLVLTNQSVVGRGLIAAAQLDEIHRRMCAAVEGAGGRIDAVLACVHSPAERCGCRKPAPGLFVHAAEALGVDLGRSLMIGDAWTDVEAARAAGCPALWIGPDAVAGPVPSARDLLDAVTLLPEC
jgi:D-glycero-D-manno-heptose 1,7-bisphosphate phosphatase